MQVFLNYLVTGVVLVTMISILVAAHELGHYLFARLFKMGVEEFSIGFGRKPLFTWMRRTYVVDLPEGFAPVQEPFGDEPGDSEHLSKGSALEGGAQRRLFRIVDGPKGQMVEESTDFTVRPWPVGGFVRIKGMLPEEDQQETKIAGGFYSKPPWQRLIVLLAGPAFSVLAGVMILVPLFMVAGIDKPILDPIMGSVTIGGPAEKAGIRPGDRILAINDKPISQFYQMLEIVRVSPNKPLVFHVDRAGKRMDFTVTPILDPVPTMVIGPDFQPTADVRRQGKVYIGWRSERIRLPFGAALTAAAETPIQAASGVIGMFAKPKRFEQQISGPATIAVVTNRAVSQGVDSVLQLAAMISISVGIMNLLPVPPLDGGQIVVALAEMLRNGKRLSLKVQNVVGMAGMIAVLSLMFGALYVDARRFIDQPRQEAAIKKQLDQIKKH